MSSIHDARGRTIAAGFGLAIVLGALAACDDEANARAVSSTEPGRANALSLPDLPEPTDAVEFRLSETGLYRDIGQKLLAPDLLEFEPAHALWSDGASKRRWLRLPAGTRIDSTDMDHWQFPAGTMLFKEFSLAGVRIETRLIARTGPGSRDYWMGAFVWNDDESDALFMPDGVRDARGTDHDVPKVKNCFTCHNGEPGRVLGFSAVQQPEVARELLSDPSSRRVTAPGDHETAAALGYLHANCAHCHNPAGSARPDTDMNLRLSVGDRTPEATQAFRTAVDQRLQSFQDTSHRLRIASGDADGSGLLYRMSERDSETQMPPLGSEAVDPDGVALVRAWIESL